MSFEVLSTLTVLSLVLIWVVSFATIKKDYLPETTVFQRLEAGRGSTRNLVTSDLQETFNVVATMNLVTVFIVAPALLVCDVWSRASRKRI